MNLAALTAARADPGVVRDHLLTHFEGVEVVETSDDRYALHCHDGQRIRLVIKFGWSIWHQGWVYQIFPGEPVWSPIPKFRA